MAQLIIAAAGAAVTAAFPGIGGALAGVAISALGNALFAPTQRVRGPELNDLRVTGTELGQPIPILKGGITTSGQVAWSSDRRKITTTTEVGGKGGPSASSTTFTYEVDIWFLVSANQIADCLRVWKNGKLVFNKTTGAPAETLQASSQTDLWSSITVYTGADTQLPPPEYEAAVGTANAVALRGMGSVFIKGLQLGPAPAQIPNLKFDIAEAVTAGIDVAEERVASFDGWNGPLTPPSFSADGWETGLYTGNSPVVGSLYRIKPTGRKKYIGSKQFSSGNLIQGTTDDDCTIIGNTSFLSVYYSRSGYTANFYYAVPQAATPIKATVRGNDFVVALSVVGGRISRYSKLGGDELAYVTGFGGANNLCIAGDKVYKFNQGETWIDEFDLVTMEWIQAFSVPGTDYIFSSDSGDLYRVETQTVYKLVGASWVTYATCTKARDASSSIGTRQQMVGNRLYNFLTDLPGPAISMWQITFNQVALASTLTIRQAVEAVCAFAGLHSSQYDASALASITTPVRGFWISGTLRQTLEQLMSGWFFTVTLSDKLYFRPRGQASVATLAYTDLGITQADSGATPQPVQLKRSNPIEVQAGLAVNYMNADADDTTGTEVSDRVLTPQDNTTTIQLPIRLTSAEAKKIANCSLADIAASALGTTLAVGTKYTRLETSDVVTVVDKDGDQYRMRLVRRVEDGGILKFDAVRDDDAALSLPSVGNTDYVGQATVAAEPKVELLMLDCPILRDADNAPGSYAAVATSTSGASGAAIYKSYDASAWEPLTNITDFTVFGEATTVLGAGPGSNMMDEASTVTVTLGPGGVLSTATRDAVMSMQSNIALLGSELIGFTTATLVSGTTYALNGLLRGLRGTEAAQSTHAVGDQFVLLRTSGLRRVTLANNELNTTRYYKAIPFGAKVATGEEETHICTGVGLRPLAPVYGRGSRSSGNLTITWARRTRGTAVFSTGVVPLFEDAELYDVEIYTSSGYSTVIRTFSLLTSATVTYTSAQQTTDFGSAQATVYARIYQRNAIVGRGLALQGAY